MSPSVRILTVLAAACSSPAAMGQGVVDGSCAMRTMPPDLHLQEETISEAEESIAVDSAVRDNHLRIIASRTAAGGPAPALRAFAMSNFLFEDGCVWTLSANRAWTAGRRSTFDARMLRKNVSPPHLPSGRFEMAYRVGYRREGGVLHTDYVGLWQQADRSLIAYFSTRAGGGFTTPRPLLRSTKRLRSVTYFPAPDTAVGRLGLLQEVEGGARLVSIDWYHPDAFR